MPSVGIPAHPAHQAPRVSVVYLGRPGLSGRPGGFVVLGVSSSGVSAVHLGILALGLSGRPGGFVVFGVSSSRVDPVRDVLLVVERVLADDLGRVTGCM